MEFIRVLFRSTDKKVKKSTTASAHNTTVIKPRKNMDIPTQICVGVPIYNEEKYISETLKSLKSQNIDNVHFLISDNQSTDNTLEICRNEVGDDERFSIIQHKENIGAAENLKFALDKSKSNSFRSEERREGKDCGRQCK